MFFRFADGLIVRNLTHISSHPLQGGRRMAATSENGRQSSTLRRAGQRASVNPLICSDLQPAGSPGILPGVGCRRRLSKQKKACKKPGQGALKRTRHRHPLTHAAGNGSHHQLAE